MCEEPAATADQVESLRAAIAEVDSELPVVPTVLRPRPVEPVAGRKVAFFSTAPEAFHYRLREHLEREHEADVVLVSGSLAHREALRAELDSPAVRDAELLLVEIKAAAIDVVAEAADASGVQVVFADNEVRPLAGRAALDDRLLALADAVTTERIIA
jgi:cyclic 2,3-diphosphoglycerate synthetase